MTWEIVTGIIALTGFVIGLIKALIPVTNAITLLTEKIDALTENIETIEQKKKESHEKIWSHNKWQDNVLMQHEMRLHDLDGKETMEKW